MTDQCIVNVSVGGWYPFGQDRLKDALYRLRYKGGFMFWRDQYPEGCPAQSAVPYAFKLYAIQAALKQGYRQILWLDSSMYPVKPVDHIFKTMRESGHFVIQDGWNVGQWCSDAALAGFGIDREEAFNIPCILAGVLGLNFDNARTADFFGAWMQKCNDGFSFLGDWTNKEGQVSKDPRVRGHRHDQVIASILINKMQMPYSVLAGDVVLYADPSRTKVTSDVTFLVHPA